MLPVTFLLIPSALCVYVETPLGVLEGRTVESLKQTQYYAFEGIPFAKPPVGKLRFVAPVAATPWTGIYNATYQRSVCPQLDVSASSGFKGNEDCLHLNVYSPRLGSKRKLAVIVYVFGGIFERNGANQCGNPEIFMDFDTLLVTFNHRLGVFGFLTLDTPEVPGNAALRDLLCVLKWVQKYIRYFGGDPDNVTLLGTSSGAVITDVVRDSPLFHNVFHKAIIMSGNKITHAMGLDTSRATSKYILIALNITNNEVDTLKILQNIPRDILLKLQAKVGLENLPYNISSFDVTIEQDHGDGQAIYVDVADLTDNCTVVNNLPTIIGHGSQDYFNLPKAFTDSIMSDKDDFILPFDWDLDTDQTKIVAQEVKKKYFRDSTYNVESVKDYDILFTLLAHVRSMVPTYNRGRQIAKCSNAPTFYYLFDYDGFTIRSHNIDFLGTMHGDEGGFMFPIETNRVDVRSSDGWVRNRLVAMYTNFAKTGNPTPEISNLLPVTWKPFDIENEHYLHISGDLFSNVHQIHRIAQFWNGLKEKYVKKKKREIVPVWKL